MADTKTVIYDVDGYDVVTDAICTLLNQYPNLDDGDEITYATLSEDGGKALFPANSAAITEEHRSITGHVEQQCIYRFHVIYRAAGLPGNRKAAVKEWLDNLGRWLEKQPITSVLDGESYILNEYPPLTDGREFKIMRRETQAYLDSINANGSENWAIALSAQYQNDFYR